MAKDHNKDKKPATTKAAQPAPKPVKYEWYPEREPQDAQMAIILEASLKKGIPAGRIAALMHHESAHTWNENARPLGAGGKPTTSALGLGQYLDSTWMYHLYSKGDTLIQDADLDRNNPAAAKAIRDLKTEFDAKSGKKDWNYFDTLMKKDGTSNKYKTVLDLRSDTRISIFAVAQDIDDAGTMLKSAGLPVNMTNLYVLHHKNIAFLADISRNPAGLPALSQAEIDNNGDLFKNKDGTPKTGAAILSAYTNIMTDESAARFGRKYIGTDFGYAASTANASPAKSKGPEKLHEITPLAAGVKPAHVKPSLIFGAPSPEEAKTFAATFKQHVQSDKTSAPMQKWMIDSLKRTGFLAKTVTADQLAETPVQHALASYMQRMGLSARKDGTIGAGVIAAMSLTNDRIERYAALQQRQASAPVVLDLKALQKDDAARATAKEQIIALKQSLIAEGALQAPTQRVKVKSGKKTITKQERIPLDAEISQNLIGAVNALQLRKGLKVTEGKLDAITLQAIGSKPVATATPLQPQTTTPQAQPIQPATQGREGKIGAPTSTPIIPRPLSMWNRVADPAVVAAQEALIKIDPRYQQQLGKVDGFYGDKTEKALATFAKEHNLPHKKGHADLALIVALHETAGSAFNNLAARQSDDEQPIILSGLTSAFEPNQAMSKANLTPTLERAKTWKSAAPNT